MSTELEQLLQALYEKRNCPPEQNRNETPSSRGCCKMLWRGYQAQAGINSLMPCIIVTRNCDAPAGDL